MCSRFPRAHIPPKKSPQRLILAHVYRYQLNGGTVFAANSRSVHLLGLRVYSIFLRLLSFCQIKAYFAFQCIVVYVWQYAAIVLLIFVAEVVWLGIWVSKAVSTDLLFSSLIAYVYTLVSWQACIFICRWRHSNGKNKALCRHAHRNTFCLSVVTDRQ